MKVDRYWGTRIAYLLFHLLETLFIENPTLFDAFQDCTYITINYNKITIQITWTILDIRKITFVIICNENIG